jgi:hypothetical protein
VIGSFIPHAKKGRNRRIILSIGEQITSLYNKFGSILSKLSPLTYLTICNQKRAEINKQMSARDIFLLQKNVQG